MWMFLFGTQTIGKMMNITLFVENTNSIYQAILLCKSLLKLLSAHQLVRRKKKFAFKTL